ncbi:strictosidine synthase, putative [Ichthyophthirius multifiliis]|uniref:Strictosidine synthase, putative n=1 Tax=Ichthyophthirius multifiliis TaxID=5932 RepID=G0R4G0_ICHMU|nr:strictosidine synthase, putative [Ichthyophthirius multifiliis]EGR27644.1 strictosidine synthase, putative [Ichthyophthirius multifiliis]|eukprot:XP_004025096.1 strictosidine synthase, putative [Ichthyophthirius multifiliis]
MSHPQERICEYSSNLASPFEIDGALYLVAQNGEILSFKENQLKNEFHFAGQPSSLVIESSGKAFYLADMAHQSIVSRIIDDNGREEIHEIIKEYEGSPLLGPHSLVLSESLNSLIFTDSGPFGETSIENSTGSVFIIDLEESVIRPLALNCLAYPSGLALSLDEKILFVCETCKNRVLRFVLTPQGIFYFSVFVNFQGRFGPITCSVSSSDLLYVGRFEFSQLSDEGLISVVNTSNGQIVENITLVGSPEISGLTFSKQKNNILYVTENSSSQQSCIRVLIQTEDKDDKKNNNKDLNNSFK